jgi:multiple sugar transport system permease protein
MLAYDEAFNTRYGPAAAYATVLFLYVAAVAYAFVKILGADVIGEARTKLPGGKRKKRRSEAGLRKASESPVPSGIGGA